MTLKQIKLQEILELNIQKPQPQTQEIDKENTKSAIGEPTIVLNCQKPFMCDPSDVKTPKQSLSILDHYIEHKQPILPGIDKETSLTSKIAEIEKILEEIDELEFVLKDLNKQRLEINRSLKHRKQRLTDLMINHRIDCITKSGREYSITR